jgi:hypothetical protein
MQGEHRSEMVSDAEHARLPARTGTRCMAPWEEPRNLASKGGRGRAVYRLGDLREFAAPKTAADLRDLLAELNYRNSLRGTTTTTPRPRLIRSGGEMCEAGEVAFRKGDAEAKAS